MLTPALAAAAIFAFLGVLHLVYTLIDFGQKPRYFRPKDPQVLEAMRSTSTALAPEGRDYWSGVLGFHLSHAMGAIVFALLIVIASQHAITWLKPVLLAVGLAYAAISYRCWFRVPTISILAADALLAWGWLF